MHATRANYRKVEKLIDYLCQYTEEKFNDLKEKYKVTLNNENVNQFKEFLKEYIGKYKDKLFRQESPTLSR